MRKFVTVLLVLVVFLAACEQFDGEVVYVGQDSTIPTGEYVISQNGTEVAVYVEQLPATTALPTESPTFTPTPVASSWTSPTPDESTQEPTQAPVTMIPYTPTPLPTVSPTPSNTPTNEPDPGVCVGTVTNEYGLNVRYGPSTSYEILTSLDYGDKVIITGFYVNSTAVDEWASIEILIDGSTGWIAAYYYNGERLLTWDDGATECLPPYIDIDGPGAVVSPTPVFAVGPRTVPGASGYDSAFWLLNNKGYAYGVSPYADINGCLLALNAGGVCVYRPGNPDCPDDRIVSDPTFNAIQFVDNAQWSADVLRDYDNVWIEPINECFGDFTDPIAAQWWATWIEAYIDEAHRRDFPPLALPGLQPGAGNDMMFDYLQPALEKLADLGGLFSMHDYTYHSQTGLCVCDQYEACRHILDHELMAERGIDLQITITEAARQSGNAVVDEDDFVCWITKAKETGYIHSVWLWLGGYHPYWPNADLTGHYISLANKLPTR